VELLGRVRAWKAEHAATSANGREAITVAERDRQARMPL
jgi:hypothetical protein